MLYLAVRRDDRGHMTCPSCLIAESDPLTGHYHGAFEGQAACQECQVRALAHGPGRARTVAVNQMTPAYKAALQAVFGDDGWEEGAKRVREWALRIKRSRAGVAV